MPSVGDRLRASVRFPVVPLVVVLAVGLALRLTGLDWDDRAHLHPDERYVTIVADQVDWPGSVAEYFDVESSPLSPYNTDSGSGYLYGQLPLFATKLVAAATGRDSYDEVHLVGRALSARVDTLSILLVFLVARIVLGGWSERTRDAAALLAAAFYALAVTAVQHAHFFTMESWLVATSLLAFWLAARLVLRPPTAPLPLAGLVATGAAVGLAAASKLSGLLVLLPVGVALVALVLRPDQASLPRRAGTLAAASLLVVVSGYLTFRLVSPYAFAHSSWLDARPNAEFRAALESQRSALDGEFLYPPAYQWLLSTPWLDPLRNEVVWGLGVPLGLAALAGLGAMTYRLATVGRARLPEPRAVARLMLLAFVAAVFVLFASRFAHSIRYLLPVVPFLCIAAAYAIGLLRLRSAWLVRLAAAGVGVATLLYALSFVTVYREPNTRVAASAWLERTTPAGARLVGEHWDDALPVRAAPERFRRSELPVFDPDDETKLRKLYDGLADADLYVLSSPRAWRTIGRLPGRFPIMTRFYAQLRDGALGFVKAAQFESPPRLFGLELSDLDAEEPFWVYDHPPVLVYRRDGELSWDRFRAALCSGEALPGCP